MATKKLPLQPHRYHFSLSKLKRDRSPSPSFQQPASQDKLLEIMKGDIPLAPGSQEEKDLEQAKNGEVILDGIWTPGDTFTTQDWRKNLDETAD